MFVETGGTGLMGREMSKIMDIKALSHQDIEIRDEKSVKRALDGADVVLHLAAYVDVVGAEKDRNLVYDTNVLGARNVARNARTLYVSTDYVFDGEKGNYKETDEINPLQYYGWSKYLGERAVLNEGGKVLRLSFKPRPYKHPKVPKEMYFSGGYVDEVAQEIKWALEHYEELPPLVHVGFKRVSLLDFARRTRNVEPMSIKDIPVPIPRDTSFDLTLWHKLKG